MNPDTNPDPVYSKTTAAPKDAKLLLDVSDTHKDWEYLISELAVLAEAVGIPADLNLNCTTSSDFRIQLNLSQVLALGLKDDDK